MALRVGDCIAAARLEHPAFSPQNVPASVAARIASKTQVELLLATHQANASYLVRTWVIALLPDQNLATFGAGSAQGAPIVQGSTDFEATDTGAGALATVDPAATTLLPERAATGGSTNTLQDTTQSWTVNAYQGAVVEIVEGTGKGQIEVVASNDANTLTLAFAWTLAPDITSIYRVHVQQFQAAGDYGVQLGQVPATASKQGWLVKLDASGQPYLDLNSPVTVPMTVGIPLPPNFLVNHGSAYRPRGWDGYDRYPLPVTRVEPSDKHQPARPHAFYVQGEQLFLCAPMEQWRHIQRLEIPYLPLAPDIVNADSLMILPEAAKEAVIAGIAVAMGERINVLGQNGVDLSGFQARQERMQQLYIDQVSGAGRAKVSRIKEVW